MKDFLEKINRMSTREICVLLMIIFTIWGYFLGVIAICIYADYVLSWLCMYHLACAIALAIYLSDNKD